MTKRIIALFVIVAMITGVLGMVGCSVDEDVPVDVDEDDALVDEDDALVDEDILYVALTNALGFDVLDPKLQSSTSAEMLLTPVYDSLIMLGMDGTIQPGLAEDWEHNEDFTVWTVYLREGVQFHDDWGEMTAEDVVFSLEHIVLDEETVMTHAIPMQEVIEELNILDDYTVEIRLNMGIPGFVDFYLRRGEGMVMCKAYYEEVGDKALLKHPIGTGRYQFVEHQEGDLIIYEATGEHWSGVDPGFDRLVLMEVPEEAARIAMLGRGEADLIDISVDGAISLQEMGYDIVTSEGSARVTMNIFGTWTERAKEWRLPTSDVRVREAMSLAINREEIAETLFSGLHTPWTAPGAYTPLIGEGVDADYWVERAKETQRYDPERAKELLEEAGFPDEFATDTITCWSYSHHRLPRQPEVWIAIAAYWEQVGIQSDIQSSDYQGHVRPFTEDPNIPDAAIGTAFMHPYASEIFPMHRTPDFYIPGGRHQYLDIHNEEWMYIRDQAANNPDPEERERYFKEFLEIVEEQYVSIGILNMSSTFAVSDKVSEWETIEGQGNPTQWLFTFKP